MSESGPALVEAAARAEFSPSKGVASSKTDLASALPTLAESLREKADLASISELLLVMHAPFVRVFGGHARTTFPEERIIRDEDIRALSQASLKDMAGLDASRFFEGGVLAVYVNGYPTDRPRGKRGVELAISALGSDVDTAVHQTIQNALGSIFPGRKPKERSATRVMARVVHALVPDAGSYVSVDVGSDATDITVFKESEVSRHASVPEGVRTILARLAATGLPEEARSLLSMSMNDECAESSSDALATEFAKAEAELTRSFGEAFTALATPSKMPSTMLVSAHPALAPSLERFFARLDFGQFAAAAEAFTVTILNADHLKRLVTFAPGAHKDSGLALSAAYAQAEHSGDH